MKSMEGLQMNNEPTTSEALATIQGLLAEMMMTGSVDSEPDALKEIEQQLTEGQLTPAEAISSAEQIIASRQDYH